MQVVEIKQLPAQSSGSIDNEAVACERKFLELPISFLISSGFALQIGVGPVLPDRILLGTLLDGRLQVQSPIIVKFTKEDQRIVAEATELDEFGFGATLSDALRDLQRAIVELYFTLEEGKDRLGPDLQRVWTTLQHQLVRRP